MFHFPAALALIIHSCSVFFQFCSCGLERKPSPISQIFTNLDPTFRRPRSNWWYNGVAKYRGHVSLCTVCVYVGKKRKCLDLSRTVGRDCQEKGIFIIDYTWTCINTNPHDPSQNIFNICSAFIIVRNVGGIFTTLYSIYTVYCLDKYGRNSAGHNLDLDTKADWLLANLLKNTVIGSVCSFLLLISCVSRHM